MMISMKAAVWLASILLLAAGASAIVSGVSGSKPDKIVSLDIVQVHSLVLVDENGDTQGVLTANKYGCMLDLRPGEHDKGFSISIHRGKSGAALMIHRDEKKVAELFASEAGGGIELRSDKGRVLFKQGVRE